MPLLKLPPKVGAGSGDHVLAAMGMLTLLRTHRRRPWPELSLELCGTQYKSESECCPWAQLQERKDVTIGAANGVPLFPGLFFFSFLPMRGSSFPPKRGSRIFVSPSPLSACMERA